MNILALKCSSDLIDPVTRFFRAIYMMLVANH